MRISDWSSDVCSSDLLLFVELHVAAHGDQVGDVHVLEELVVGLAHVGLAAIHGLVLHAGQNRRQLQRIVGLRLVDRRSEEHTSELQSLMRISYAVFCLKKKKKQTNETAAHKKQQL